MANRYAKTALWCRRSTDGKDEFVGLGALRDSTDQVVVQCPAMFQNTPLTDTEMTGVLKGWRDKGNHGDTGP
jgi:hypothetical protein